MAKSSKYVAKIPDAEGIIHYSEQENDIWRQLIERQMPLVEQYACQVFIDGLECLDLPKDRIPQCNEVSKVLMETTGWQVEPVPALINFKRFFDMLANKTFPAASFIRSQEELDYLQEPDIFHEIFGHTPLLTNQHFADFTEHVGKIGQKANETQYSWLARIYWFTIEFGLLKTSKGVKPLGSGLASSFSELAYAAESHEPQRKPFELMDVLRTPYRIDIHQPIYFILQSTQQLFDLVDIDLLAKISEAQQLGLHEPAYPPKVA